ncbi:STAS domain-containing protein [Mycobacterium deserti]|uniref:Anti-sigma factor antagonist n=1 Tax=Mycobacterium deserti TaxID=2978347 RepID=A0ABT2MFS4_9MYCO|nr:STAS domain-containing protein [Mycobacterium deserti]MCT7661138.1 STAS domain-containing protein [Mycobacterium deserti]
MALLEVSQDVRDSAVILSAAGEIDSSTIDHLRGQLDAAFEVASEHSARLLVVELGHVTYFGSAGLNSILDCHERGRADGVVVRLVASTAEVIRPIEVTKLDDVLRPYPTVADAVDDSSPRR